VFIILRTQTGFVKLHICFESVGVDVKAQKVKVVLLVLLVVLLVQSIISFFNLLLAPIGSQVDV